MNPTEKIKEIEKGCGEETIQVINKEYPTIKEIFPD